MSELGMGESDGGGVGWGERERDPDNPYDILYHFDIQI